MGLGPQSPVELNVGASRGLSEEGSRSSVGTALDVGGGDILNRAVAGDLPGDSVGDRAHVGASMRQSPDTGPKAMDFRGSLLLVGLVEFEVRSSNGTVGNVAVSSNEGCRGNKREGLSGSHFDFDAVFTPGWVRGQEGRVYGWFE